MNPIRTNVLTFLAGALIGSLASANVPGIDRSLTFIETELADPTKPPGYCETFPEQCDQGGECPPIERDPITGRVTGGCTLAEFVCCQEGLGCWAVFSPTACGDASLYWLDCEAGEQVFDPVTGEASVICHD
jgi:hypothetical protein